MSIVASIDDFVNFRWADAKEALRNVDPDYVSKLENTTRLQASGLEPLWEVNYSESPKKRLSKEWHHLLETCYELVRHVIVLDASRECFRNESLPNLSLQISGARVVFGLRSWFMHAVVLCDQTDLAIFRSLDVYVSDTKSKKEMREKYRIRIRESVRKHIDYQRNSYVHPEKEAWSQGITRQELWEGTVSIGITPRREFEKYSLFRMGKRAQDGEYKIFDTYTEEVLTRLGQILHDFEEDLVASYNLEYRMGTGP